MRNVLGTNTVLDTAFLDRMREAGDPPADAVAAALCDRGAHPMVADPIRNRQM